MTAKEAMDYGIIDEVMTQDRKSSSKK